MVQFVLTGKLVFLKKLLDHVRKYKFDIHRRILGVIMVFFLKAFKMSPELFYILAGDILGNRLHKLRILHTWTKMARSVPSTSSSLVNTCLSG